MIQDDKQKRYRKKKTEALKKRHGKINRSVTGKKKTEALKKRYGKINRSVTG